MAKQLSEGGREQLAVALILLKDWKSRGKFDPELILIIRELAEHIGVLKEYDHLMYKVLP